MIASVTNLNFLKYFDIIIIENKDKEVIASMSMLDLNKYETFDHHLFTTQLKPIMEKTSIGKIAGIILDRWSNDPRRLRFFFQPETKPEDATRVVLQWAENNGLELVRHSHSGRYTDLFGFTKGIDDNRDRWYAEVVIIVKGERK